MLIDLLLKRSVPCWRFSSSTSSTLKTDIQLFRFVFSRQEVACSQVFSHSFQYNHSLTLILGRSELFADGYWSRSPSTRGGVVLRLHIPGSAPLYPPLQGVAIFYGFTALSRRDGWVGRQPAPSAREPGVRRFPSP